MQADILADTLPALQKAVTVLHEREAESLGISAETTMVVVDVALTSGLRIEADYVPIIRVSAFWLYDCVIGQKTDLIVYALRRAIVIGHNKLRWTLNRRKTRFAAEYIEKARTFRTAASDGFSLPVNNFRVRYVIEMVDVMTGEVEKREHIKSSEIENVEKEMAQLLTAKVYSHKQAADLLDMLHAHKLAMQEPSSVVASDIHQISPTHAIEKREYEDSAAIPTRRDDDLHFQSITEII